jgi:hypothetical protein
MTAAFRFASHGVHFQISKSQVGRLLRPTASKQRPGAGQKLWERKRFHKVIVSTFVEPCDAVLDCIARGEDENRSLQSSFSNCGQHLEPIATGKHEIQNHEIEFLSIHKEESLFPGRRNDNFVLVALQSFPKGTRHFHFVFHDEDAQSLPTLLDSINTGSRRLLKFS